MGKKHGGSRMGAGRKPKPYEEKVIDSIKKSITDDDFQEIWQKIALEAKKGNPAHIKILFEYFYGKPQETVRHEMPETELKIVKTIIHGRS